MFKELNPILHSELRLAIISLLVSERKADFMWMMEQTKASGGNMSVQVEKLTQAGYIETIKSFKGKRPCTTCKITKKGLIAFDEYVDALKSYIVK